MMRFATHLNDFKRFPGAPTGAHPPYGSFRNQSKAGAVRPGFRIDKGPKRSFVHFGQSSNESEYI
jgi:hypothetical protein